ncbi:MAG: hypothetical protein JXC32_17070 [Anaerolineae bacterium]|nr:hypothetical protein [Anaerolineae bacterium]
MPEQTISRSADVEEARARLLERVKAWAYACVAKYGDAMPTDIHDQATYTTGWAPYLVDSGDAELLHFLKRLRDQIRDHFVATDQWHHGYWRAQEAHHGTEHFELFLGTLYRLDPADGETQRQLLDAAEHIGNWVDGIPSWFDPSTGLFRSMYLGTEIVRAQPGMDLNVPDHLRFVNLCLLAHEMRAERRYLAFADAYARQWAEVIADAPELPIGLTPAGPITAFDATTERAYRRFAGMTGHLDDNLDRAENLLASNGIGAMLTLWRRIGEPVSRRAVERLVAILVTQVADPDAGPAAAAVRAYRSATGDRRYDQAVLDAIDDAAAVRDPQLIRQIGIEPNVRRPERPHGIGKRADMPNWFEDGAPRRHNPITLAIAAEIRGDTALTTCALDLARTYLEVAMATLPDGRHHGCAANTVSAVARGHGRDNGAGVITGVLGCQRTGDRLGFWRDLVSDDH